MPEPARYSLGSAGEGAASVAAAAVHDRGEVLAAGARRAWRLREGRCRRGEGAEADAAATEAAKVFRATAYRYFPTQEALLVEVSALASAVVPVEAALAALPAEGDAEARRLLLLDTWFEGRRAGEESPAVREGRRERWLDRALEPVRQKLPEREWRRLRAALSLTLGSEALIVMKDVCRLDNRESLEVLRWAAAALLRAGLEEARGAGLDGQCRETRARRATGRVRQP